MIEIDRHIEILLLSNDCVIVPDLGGFMAHRIEARYDESDHTFLPPLRTLGFNPQLTMNDSLLVQSYVEAYDMSYPEALRRIEDEVNELKQHLENEGSYELSDIGTLALNEDGHYLFTPCEAGILTPDLYGLSSFEMKDLDISSKQVQEEKEEVKDIEANVADTTLDVEEGEDTTDSAIVIKMSWIRNTVAIAAAVLAFFLMTTPVTNSNHTNRAIGQLNSPALLGKIAKDSNMKKLDVNITRSEKAAEVKKDTLATVKPDIEKPENAKAVAAEPVSEGPAYCIVLASYITQKNANSYVEALHKKGYTDAQVYVRNNVTRVIMGHYDSINKAYNKLNNIHHDKDFEEAWVMKI